MFFVFLEMGSAWYRTLFWLGGFPYYKMDYRKTVRTLILTSLLEDLPEIGRLRLAAAKG